MTNLDKSKPAFFDPIFLYGPPGSGKTSVGKELAKNLALPFVDLDEMIEEQAGKSIPEIFAEQGEDGFRKLEKKALQDVLKMEWGVIALGGGALIDEDNRDDIRRGGPNIILAASEQAIIDRLTSDELQRPLLGEQDMTKLTSNLQKLLVERASHYASFENQIVTDSRAPVDIAWDAQVIAGAFYVRGMTANPGKGNLPGAGKNRPGPPGYDVRVAYALDNLGEAMRLHGMSGPVVVVTDQNVAEHYLSWVEKSLRAEDYSISAIIIPPGEESKTMVMVSQLWETFLDAGLERGSTVVALGGGVIGDMAGFAAATYMRGIPWVNVPTTLLSMVDASLGGKTGVDLPQGKNLIGAFHAPRMVLTDPSTLKTLPREEQRSGMAEVIKVGIIGDPGLLDFCRDTLERIEVDFDEIIRRAMAVKIKVIEADPFEGGLRAVLNLGHTIGHAVEKVSNYSIRHGEAVAIGMVAEARLSERIGLAERGLADEIADACRQIDLPVDIPDDLPLEDILEALKFDKKRAGAKVKFALPVKIGEVQPGVEVSDLEDLLW
jgi:shikimate kinase/3-dehydroquinate synthase